MHKFLFRDDPRFHRWDPVLFVHTDESKYMCFKCVRAVIRLHTTLLENDLK